MPAAQNLYDAIDLSDNALVALENIPQLRRLRCLLLSGNRLSSVASSVATALPFLETLVLSNNRLSSLGDIASLSPLPRLTMLFLLGNPLTRKEHYRLFTIARFPALRLLDGQRVTRKERVESLRWASSKKGKAFIAGVEEEKERAAAARGVGGEGGAGGGVKSSSSGSSSGVAFSSVALGLRGERVKSAATGAAFSSSGSSSSSGSGVVGGGGGGSQQVDVTERLQAAIARAKTASEIDMLEAALKNGTIVEVLDRLEGKGVAASAPAAVSAPASSAAAGAAGGGGGGDGGGGGGDSDMEE
jgi:hypothetical protein